jgi:hypothetical protein
MFPWGMNKKQLLKWHLDIIAYYEDNEWIEVERFNKVHFRIKRLSDGAKLDFWPSTGKARKIMPTISKVFQITCLDTYLEKYFK